MIALDRAKPNRKTQMKTYTEEDWIEAMDLASVRFNEAHELPKEAHPRDREEWEETETERILKEKGFTV